MIRAGRRSPLRTSPTCPVSKKACTPGDLTTCGLSGQIEGLISNFERVIDGFLAGLTYDALIPAIQKTNTTIDVPIADLGFSSEAK